MEAIMLPAPLLIDGSRGAELEFPKGIGRSDFMALPSIHLLLFQRSSTPLGSAGELAAE
jgi:hypothetical protein